MTAMAKLFFVKCIFSLCLLQLTQGNVLPTQILLTPKEPHVVENTELTLHCSFNVHLPVINWRTSRFDTLQTIYLPNCTTDGAFINNTSEYEYKCGEYFVNLTVKHIIKHNERWQCYQGFTFSNNVTLYVIIPLRYIIIVNEVEGQLTVEENETTNITCRSSPSRPGANLEWRIGTTDSSHHFQKRSVPQEEQINWQEGLVVSNISTTLHLNRTSNGKLFQCIGNNTDGSPVVNQTILNVTYPPNNVLEIAGIQNGTAFSIKEYTECTFMCLVDESNPPTYLNWSCINPFFNISYGRNTQNLTWTALRGKNTQCTCQSTYMLRDYGVVHVNIDTLYPPENVTINSTKTPNYQLTDNITVIENTKLLLLCSAVANPEPSNYSWIGIYSSESRELQISPNKTSNGNVTCVVTNTMVEEPKNETTVGTNSKTYILRVLYPPIIKPDLENVSIIEGNSTTVVCEIIPGNPIPTYIRWINTTLSDNKSVLNISRANRKDSRWHRCEVNNTMEPTYGDTQFGSDTRQFYLEVLYQPENMIINSTTAPKNYQVLDNITIIENTFLKLSCFAEGKPTPSFSWSGYNSSNTSEVHIHGTRTKRESISCAAKNIMTESPGRDTFVGMIRETLPVEVLYPPEVNLTYRSVQESEDVNISCVQTQGKTTHQSVHWISRLTNVTNSNNLIIRNVTRKHAGNCTCVVNYTMIPSYGEIKSDSIIGVVYLDVFYKAELLNFFVGQNNQTPSVTVNENDNVRMICILDSNPNSTMQISIRNSIVSNDQNTKTLEHYIRQTSCNDAGNYTCYGFNFLNTINSSRELRLFVNCSPRKSSLIEVQQNLTSHNGTATFSFTALAYPLPSFKWWFRRDNSDLKEADNGNNTTVIISENEMQINFTVSNVATSDYGEYVLTINNTFGIYNQSFFLLQEDATNDKQTSPPGGGNAGQIAGGVIGGILSISAIVAAVFLVRRSGYFRKARNDDGGHHEYQNVGFTGELKQSKRLPALPPEEESEDVHGDHRTIVQQQQQDYDADEHPYLNTMELIDLMKKVNVSDLFSYVNNMSYQEFSDEFGKFPSGLMVSIPCSIASRPQNAPLNRYQGIYPYDHSRVIISGQPDFFINASYIDGYSGEHQYIASLGPTVKHTLGFRTFWNMVWHQGSDVIVMLTNLQEPSGMKCEKYWADRGTTRILGDFTIQSIEEEVAAEYKVRTFKVFKGDESRMVTQLHYTAWPDKKVPEDVTSLIEFRQRVKAAPTRSNGPLIVHCSAGVGRTGTYIALDRLIKEGKSKNAINVFDCVMNMRKQRVNMVQTLDQYVYLHQALVYCLVFDIEPVSSNGIDEYVKKTSNNVYSKLFQQLQQTVEDETIEEKEARAKNGDMLEKNRTTADIPSDAHRIRLVLDKQMGESDYINAVYLNGFKRQEHFIIAQSPLPTTLDDFVCLMYQATCCCIVSLDDYQQTGASNVTYLPPDNQPMKYGTFTISCSSLDVKSGYSVRKLKLGFTGQVGKGERIVYHFEFTGWKHDDRTPKDPKLFVDFIKEVDKYATELEDEHSHVLVHCMSGSERSGLFCAVYNLMDKMEQERQVSVVNMLRRVRARRKTAFPNMEQLKFCYQALNAFVKSHKI